jgi:Methyltransferase FkbM domain
LNGLDNVVTYSFALGDEDGVGSLGSGFEGNSGSRSLTWTLDRSKMEVVTVRRGDDLFQQENLSRIDLLKLDVEGYEKRVLAGLRDRLLRDRPIVLMELIGQSEKSGFRDAAELHAAFYPAHEFFRWAAAGRPNSFRSTGTKNRLSACLRNAWTHSRKSFPNDRIDRGRLSGY